MISSSLYYCFISLGPPMDNDDISNNLYIYVFNNKKYFTLDKRYLNVDSHVCVHRVGIRYHFHVMQILLSW